MSQLTLEQSVQDLVEAIQKDARSELKNSRLEIINQRIRDTVDKGQMAFTSFLVKYLPSKSPNERLRISEKFQPHFQKPSQVSSVSAVSSSSDFSQPAADLFAPAKRAQSPVTYSDLLKYVAKVSGHKDLDPRKPLSAYILGDLPRKPSSPARRSRPRRSSPKRSRTRRTRK